MGLRATGESQPGPWSSDRIFPPRPHPRAKPCREGPGHSVTGQKESQYYEVSRRNLTQEKHFIKGEACLKPEWAGPRNSRYRISSAEPGRGYWEWTSGGCPGKHLGGFWVGPPGSLHLSWESLHSVREEKSWESSCDHEDMRGGRGSQDGTPSASF